MDRLKTKSENNFEDISRIPDDFFVNDTDFETARKKNITRIGQWIEEIITGKKFD